MFVTQMDTYTQTGRKQNLAYVSLIFVERTLKTQLPNIPLLLTQI